MAIQTTVNVYRHELEKIFATEIERLMINLSNGHAESLAEYKYAAGVIAGLRTAYEYLDEADKIYAEKYR